MSLFRKMDHLEQHTNVRMYLFVRFILTVMVSMQLHKTLAILIVLAYHCKRNLLSNIYKL